VVRCLGWMPCKIYEFGTGNDEPSLVPRGREGSENEKYSPFKRLLLPGSWEVFQIGNKDCKVIQSERFAFYKICY
jgi:hypothetical protein